MNKMKVYKEVSIEVKGLGEKIRKAREADLRPLTTICELIGMARTNWYDIEKEAQSIPYETLQKIETVLGVNFGIVLE